MELMILSLFDAEKEILTMLVGISLSGALPNLRTITVNEN